MFYDKLNVDFNANVVRINTFSTRKGIHGAFITTASQNGKRTVYIKSIAWGKQADATYKVARMAKQAPKGKKKIHIFARLTQYVPTTQNGDRIKTIMPVVKKINRVNFNHANKRSDNANHQNRPASSANHSTNQKKSSAKSHASKASASVA